MSSNKLLNVVKLIKNTLKINGNLKKSDVLFIRNFLINFRPQRKYVTSFIGISTSSYL